MCICKKIELFLVHGFVLCLSHAFLWLIFSQSCLISMLSRFSVFLFISRSIFRQRLTIRLSSLCLSVLYRQYIIINHSVISSFWAQSRFSRCLCIVPEPCLWLWSHCILIYLEFHLCAKLYPHCSNKQNRTKQPSNEQQKRDGKYNNGRRKETQHIHASKIYTIPK